MKIRANVPIATINHCYMPGQDYEIEDREGELLIAAGQAAAVNANNKPEPVKLDAKPSTPVEKVDAVVAPAAPAAAAPVVAVPAATKSIAATADEAKPTPAAALTAIDAVKKGSK